MKKIANFITRNSRMIVIFSLLLLIPSFIGYKNTRVNYNLLVYLPSDIETMKGQDILTDDFELGTFAFIIAPSNSAKEILTLEEKIKSVDTVNLVASVFDVTDTALPIQMLPSDVLDKVARNNETIIMITLKENTSNEKTMNAIEKIRDICDKYYVSGMTAMALDTMNLSQQEIVAYILLAVFLCLVVLLVTTDSYFIPVLLLCNIGVAIIYNMGSNIFLGSISYITKAISAVLQLGVTTDFSIFLYHKYEQSKKKHNNNILAMNEAIVETFNSIIGSATTTIAGFLALCSMQLTLGKDIGLVMAKGVALGFVCVLVLFPALLLTFDKLIDKTKHKSIFPKFEKLQDFAIKKYKLILVIFVLLVIPAWYGNKNVNIYYKLDESLPSTLSSSIANKKLKDDFNIISPEVILLDKDIKKDRLEELEERLYDIDAIDLVLIPSNMTLGIPSAFLDEDLTKNFESDKYQLLFINSTYEIATNELNKQIEEVDELVKSYDGDAIIAGEGPLTKDLVTISDKDFKNVNYTSIIIIFILIAMVLKSYSLPIILVCVIEVAIFANMAIAYYTGVTLPFVASIVIGTIQLGATIDYAILISTKYLDERKCHDKFTSMRNTLETSVPSIVSSALCFFAATFGVKLYSKIDMIGSLCELLARGSIISMLMVILTLPALILVFDNIILKTTAGMKGERNMKKNKGLAMLVFGLILFPMEAKALTKEEIVYTNMDYYGNIYKSIVSNHLYNIGDNDINDETELKNILNINGRETYTLNGNKLVWSNLGNDIYYQGDTENELPISVKVKYFLNGEEYKVEDILKKKGNVKIELTFENNSFKYVNINGKNEKLYTPFVITVGTVVLNKNGSNFTVSNGKAIGTGSKNIIVSIASPGIEESLDMNGKDDLDKIIISYDTNSFKPTDIYLVVTPKLLTNVDYKVFDKLNSVSSNVSVMQGSMTAIAKGAYDLQNNYVMINQGISDVNDKLTLFNEYTTKLVDGTSLLNDNIDLIIKTLEDNLSKLNTSEYKDKINKLNTLIQTNDKTISNLLEKTGMDYETLSNIYFDGTDEQKALVKDSYELITLLKTNNESITELLDMIMKTTNDTKNLLSNIKALRSETGKLEDNIISIDSNMEILLKRHCVLNNNSKLYLDGINNLANGILKFNNEGVTELSKYVSKVNSYSERVENLVKLSKNYHGFASGNADNTSFVFVIKK